MLSHHHSGYAKAFFFLIYIFFLQMSFKQHFSQ